MHNLVFELLALDRIPLEVLGGIIVLLWFAFYVMSIVQAHRDAQFAVASAAISTMWSYEFLFVFVWPVSGPLWYVEVAWLALDTVLLMQVFRFGAECYPHPFLRRFAFRVTLGTWLGAFVLLAAYIFYYELFTGDVVAYGVDLLLAVLMLTLLFHRPDGTGISLSGNWARAIADLLVAVTVWTNYAWTMRYVDDPGTTGDNNPLSAAFFVLTIACDALLMYGLTRAWWKRRNAVALPQPTG